MKKLNANALKYIAIIAMLIDHVAASMTITLGGVQIDSIMRIVGRTTMPIMCFFIAEGYYKTRDKKKYALRLLVFAIVSEVPFRLLFEGNGSNVIFTLLAGLCALWAYDTLKVKSKLLAVLSVIGICIAVSLNIPGVINLMTDYMLLGVLAIFFTAKIKASLKPILPSLILVGVMLLMNVVSVVLPSSITGYTPTFSEVMIYVVGYAVAMLVPMMFLYMYNGERGRKGNKYVFYIFYPLHMLVLYIITDVAGIITIAL